MIELEQTELLLVLSNIAKNNYFDEILGHILLHLLLLTKNIKEREKIYSHRRIFK